MRRTGLTWVLSHILLQACSAPGGGAFAAPALDASTDPSSFDSLGADASPGEVVDLDSDAALSEPDPVLPRVALFPANEQLDDCPNQELDFDFSPEERAFSVDAAFWAMWFAERAMFHDDPLTKLELEALGFTRYQIVTATEQGMQAYVAARPDVVVVAFRGSTELIDWMGDFNFPQNDGAEHGVPGHVHRGFSTALEASWPTLERLIVASVDRHQPIWLTGHSLGGAEATMAAVRLAKLGLPIGPLYTFGAPRAGDETFARAGDALLGGAVYRLVNESDLVPRLPPTAAAANGASPIVPFAGGIAASWLRDLAYLHPGQMWWFADPEGGGLTSFPSLDESQDVPYWEVNGHDGAVGLIAKSGEQGKRHAPTRYLCRLLGLRED